MPVDLDIEDVPDEMAEKLQRMAERNGRTLHDEILAILVEYAGGSGHETTQQRLIRMIRDD